MRGRSLLGTGNCWKTLDAIAGRARDQGWALLYLFGHLLLALSNCQSPRSDLYSRFSAGEMLVTTVLVIV